MLATFAFRCPICDVLVVESNDDCALCVRRNCIRPGLALMENPGSGTSRSRRCLTVPGVGTGNDGYDNENNDLILNVDDILVMKERRWVAVFFILCLRGLPSFVALQALPCIVAFSNAMSREQQVIVRDQPSVGHRYIVRDMLGQGTFGQVVRCCREDTREEVAVKVIKNQTAFYHQVSGASMSG